MQHPEAKFPVPPWPIPLEIAKFEPANAKNQPPTLWNSLRFSPIGVYHLRCWQGIFPGVRNFFIASQSRFRSADIAWFCSGLSRDNNHNHPQASFHPSLVTLVRDTNSYAQGKTERKALLAEVKDLMFDSAVMYDRLTGGTTMIISTSGTTIPGSPMRPEFLKASVYLPPAFVAHNPDLHNSIIDIVQQYIETVGVRTATMWTQRARRDLNYSLSLKGNPYKNANFNAIPKPELNSAHYTFLGQPYRIVQDPSITSVRAPSPDGSVASYDFGEDPDPLTLVIIDLQQESRELQDQIKILSADLKRSHDQIALLEGQLQRFIAETPMSTMSTLSTPLSTPSRNVVAPVTPPPQPTQAHTPSYRSPGQHTPATPSRHLGAASLSFGHRNFTVSRSIAAIDGSSADDLVPLYEPMLPQYINQYNLHDIAVPLGLISTYTPSGYRTQELVKLGLGRDVCDALAKAMALDSLMLPSSGKHANE